jgi:hypothetical protein
MNRPHRCPAGWLLPAFVLAANACVSLQPRTNALEQIHTVYRSDFEDIVLPRAGERPSRADDPPPFTETLRRIRDFRARFGEDSQEAAHLVVLEGMIYLQTGRFGMANVLKPDVQQAAERLKSGGGKYTRDRLFAEAFQHLVDGWRLALAAQASNLPAGGDDQLEAAADAIRTMLTQLDPDRLAAPEADHGAIYLATNAAIFWQWSHQVSPDPSLLASARDLIGCFLSDTERRAAAEVDTNRPSQSRIRFLEWYQHFASRAEGVLSAVQCPTS